MLSSKQILQNLEKKGYKIEEILEHDNIAPFVAKNLRNRNLLMKWFWIINVTGLIIFLYSVFLAFDKSLFTEIIVPITLGFLLTILLIPFHEGIHGMAYKICGAQKISFGVNWKQMYFTASAHLFVATYRKFLFIGLLPFILINIIGAIFFISATPYYQTIIISCLLIHNAMCIGDFSILSYLYGLRTLSPVTFDDTEQTKSYFLIKEN